VEITEQGVALLTLQERILLHYVHSNVGGSISRNYFKCKWKMHVQEIHTLYSTVDLQNVYKYPPLIRRHYVLPVLCRVPISFLYWSVRRVTYMASGFGFVGIWACSVYLHRLGNSLLGMPGEHEHPALPWSGYRVSRYKNINCNNMFTNTLY
jgi:hypothetical protein